MPDDIFEWVWRGIVTLISLIGALLCYFAKRALNSLDESVERNGRELSEVRDIVHTNALDLERFKTHVSDHYAKETTIQRVHDRIDAMGRDISSGFSDVRNDIKNLISRVGFK